MPAGDPYVPDHGDPSFSVTHYDLDLDYKVGSNRLVGRAVIAVTAEEAVDRLRLDLAGLRVSKVAVDGRPARWSHRGARLTVTLPRGLHPHQSCVLTITYAGTPRPARTVWGEIGWEELDDGVLVASQPCGAATWFPCNDHPRAKSTFRLSIGCDSPYLVEFTGRLTSERVKGSHTRRVFVQSRPMATYLAALHVGQYSRFVLADEPVPQEVVLPARLLPQVLPELERQPEMIDLFIGLFGPYPFEGYTVVVTPDDLEIPLEAQGMATFGPNWLTGRRSHERLVAHELAHQWFGNSLTLSAWQHIWLNEGFACYAEWLWSEASGGPSADALAQEHWARINALPHEIVLADPGPALMFDDRVYKRGALTLHALRRRLGDLAFFGLVRTWVATHEHGSVSTDDFIGHVLAVDDSTAMQALLDDWLWEPALPALDTARCTT